MVSHSHISDEKDAPPVAAVREETRATKIFWPLDLLSFDCRSQGLLIVFKEVMFHLYL
jgi:hypothetical protein